MAGTDTNDRGRGPTAPVPVPMPRAGPDLAFLKDAVTIIPIVHVLAACFFLYGYAQGFDGHIVAFYAITDLFSASIREIGQIYIFLALPVALSFLIDRNPVSSPRRRIALAAAVVLVAVIVGYVFGFGRSVASLSGRTLVEYACWVMMTATLAGVLTGFRYASRSGAGAKGRSRAFMIRSATLCIALLSFALFFGTNKGLRDLKKDWAAMERQARYFTCEQWIIVRPVGAYYLGHHADGTWHLIDGEECKSRFVLPAKKAG